MKTMRVSFISQLKKADVIREKSIFFLEKVKDLDIMDVGVVGQLHGKDSETWLHGKIVKAASSALGVDIDVNQLKELSDLGYKVAHIDELTNDVRYDVIVIGDVIEHVDNVRIFLEFYKSKCIDNGLILISTPNPQNIELNFDILFNGIPCVNSEHTNYIDPLNLFEQIRRIRGLNIENFLWVDFIKRKGLKWKILHPLCRILARFRPYFYPSYVVAVRVCHSEIDNINEKPLLD